MHYVLKKEKKEKNDFLKTPKNGFLGVKKKSGTEQLSPVMMGGGPPFENLSI